MRRLSGAFAIGAVGVLLLGVWQPAWVGAGALAVGLAFGLGNRELAGEITRRWYEQGQRRDRRRSDMGGPNMPPGEDPPILD